MEIIFYLDEDEEYGAMLQTDQDLEDPDQQVEYLEGKVVIGQIVIKDDGLKPLLDRFISKVIDAGGDPYTLLNTFLTLGFTSVAEDDLTGDECVFITSKLIQLAVDAGSEFKEQQVKSTSSE